MRMRGKEYCDEIVRLIDDVFRELDLDPLEKTPGGGKGVDIHAGGVVERGNVG
jgi:hypothetical protein